MNEPWITVVSVGVVGLGVLAEVNLLRIFVGDWLRGRRESHKQRTHKETPMTRSPSAFEQPLARTSPRLVAAICAAGISATSSFAAPGDLVATSAGRGEVLLGPVLSFQPGEPVTPSPAPDAKPLTISTDRPGFSDSSGIAALWHLQLETGYTFTFRNRDDVETQTHNGPELLARIGIIEDRLELRLGTSGYVWSRSNTGSAGEFESVEGFSDLYVGFKLKLLDQDGFVPRLAFEAITTLGTGSRSISNRDVDPTLKLIGSWDLGSGFTLTSNAVATYATASGERFVQGAGSVSLSYAATDSLSLFAEHFVVGPRSKGTDAAHSVDFGGAYLLNNRVQLDARIGVGLNQEADNVFVGVGISFLF